MSEPICTVMVGLPGLGKSTLAYGERKVYDAINARVFTYSTDAYIETVAATRGKTYDEVFADTIEVATKNMENFLQNAIEDRRDVIWDQTNLGVGKRRKIINRMKQAGYQVRCVCIIPPEVGWLDDQKTWAHRLKNRPGKTIPQHVLSNIIESFTIPTIEEGFDMITFYNMHGALLSIDYGEQ